MNGENSIRKLHGYASYVSKKGNYSDFNSYFGYDEEHNYNYYSDKEIYDNNFYVQISYDNAQKLVSYFEKHREDKCDKNTPYFIFNFYGLDSIAYYYINETTELMNILQEIGYIED